MAQALMVYFSISGAKRQKIVLKKLFTMQLLAVFCSIVGVNICEIVTGTIS